MIRDLRIIPEPKAYQASGNFWWSPQSLFINRLEDEECCSQTKMKGNQPNREADHRHFLWAFQKATIQNLEITFEKYPLNLGR